nr:sigma-70 family RNA polymerase sigma factor [Phytoactinopolyspora alkaliphila]
MLERVRNGDESAFAVLYYRAAPVARRAAQRIVRDIHVAEDLVQESFYLTLRALRSGHGPTDSFGGYVVSTVRRLAYRYTELQARTVSVDDFATWESSATTTNAHHDDDLVTAAWASLPARWRRVLWLIEVDQYSPAELAPSMSMTPNAVSSLATRARRALRTAYVAQQQAVTGVAQQEATIGAVQRQAA